MASDAVITIQKLSKRYPRAKADAVHQVSLSVMAGEVYGFLGPNGAGKSTTIGMMMNLLKPTQGSIYIFGQNNAANGLACRARIGYLPSDMALDSNLSGLQQLTYFGNLRGGFRHKAVHELAERINCNLHKKIGSLSRGNRQKVGLIAALMQQPDLLILDEPTSGLDPLIQVEFNKMILEHKERGGTTFISSHVLSEVQQLCDRVGIIKNGKLIADNPLHSIMAGAPKQVRILSTSGDAHNIVYKLKGAKNIASHGDILSFTFSGDLKELIERLRNHRIADISIEQPDLEQIFMSYYKGSKT